MSDSAPVFRLADVPTGPRLAQLLSRIDLAAVPDAELPEVLAAAARQLACQQEQLWAVMAELAGRNPMASVPAAASWPTDQVFESGVEEVRAELRLTRRSARRETEYAALIDRMPRVALALAAGRIDRTRAIVLAESCSDLTPSQVTKVLDEVLANAGEVTATALRDRVRRLAIALDPAWAERRYQEAVRQRRVVGYLQDDGTATVSAHGLPADEAAVALARVDSLADTAKRRGAAARIDELRTELFLGLLDGRWQGNAEDDIVADLLARFPRERSEPPATSGRSAPGRAGVELRVGLATLVGTDDAPGEIAGWGAVPASVARRLAAEQRRCEWRFAVVDAEGRLLFDGVTRRRPAGDEPTAPVRRGIVELQLPVALLDDPELGARHPAWSAVLADIGRRCAEQGPIVQDPGDRFAGRRLRRRSQVQHRTCLFPGCRRPAADCDLDHRREYADGGPTTEANLGPGCRHDHGLKTERGWRLVKHEDGTYTWISPLGRRHRVAVDPVARPLPTPLPRAEPPEPSWLLDEPEDPIRPSFTGGRRDENEPVRRPIRPATDPDPPPF